VAPPALDDDSGLSERVEDFAVEQLVAKARVRTSITSIALSLRATRIAKHSWLNSSSRTGKLIRENAYAFSSSRPS
jgi:hypothetical protein